MSMQALANFLADILNRDDVGVAERGTIAGDSVVTSRGSYSYELACPVNVYDGKEVWVQIAEEGIAVVIGD